LAESGSSAGIEYPDAGSGLEAVTWPAKQERKMLKARKSVVSNILCYREDDWHKNNDGK
jgi:hypothetical protein